MKDLMIIESRDPLEVGDAAWGMDLARGAVGAGAKSCVMLVDNGVFAARAGVAMPDMPALADSGVVIFADRFALAERGIPETGLARGVAAADLGMVIDWLDAGASVLWR